MRKYPFPALITNGEAPLWRDGHYSIGENKVNVLDYLAGKSDFGWSDGLTLFHENEAGDNHFIDQASRADALRELHCYVSHPESVILEIGCSSGYMLDAIERDFPRSLVMGADIVCQPLELLSKKMPHVPLMRFDLTQCPLPDNSVDAIVMLNVLEHIEADQKAMQQVMRILKPGGVVIIEVPAGPGLYDIYDKMLFHFRRYTIACLGELMRNVGLEVKRMSHLGCFLYPGFWWVKKRNRVKFSKSSAEVMQAQVSKSIRDTRQNTLLGRLMQIELALGKWISYPIGIRCLITCQKGSR